VEGVRQGTLTKGLPRLDTAEAAEITKR